MGDNKSPLSLSPMGGRDRDRELLIPVSGGGSAPGDGVEDGDRASSASAALSSSGREAFHKVVRSWASKKFMTGCVILFPIAITFYITWWFIHFVDGFFSPIYAQLGINIFGLGFVTSVTFIFLIGVFMSSWLGASVLSLGEWIIKRMPLVRHIYNASKQISAAISPGVQGSGHHKASSCWRICVWFHHIVSIPPELFWSRRSLLRLCPNEPSLHW
uniref:Protein CONTINUOUS VASCULAR RING 1 n=1 Tax=Zea mays TaxID=4577 RepID=A0A804Q2Y6_MAIZE